MPLIDVNATSLFYDETGPSHAPAVLLSNSLGTTLEMWDAQVRALASRFRVIRYDTRGHGRSPATGDTVTIDTLTDDAAALLAALGIAQAHVVGLSLGGLTAQALALRHPGRVASLVLMATAAHLPSAEAWESRAVTVLETGMGAIVDAAMQRWFTPEFGEVAPARLASIRKAFLQTDPVGYAACCRALRDADLRGSIGAIAVPTMVVAGEHDPVTTLAIGEALARAIPGAGFEMLPRAAHLFVVERPDQSNAILSAFLGAQGPPGVALPEAAFMAGLANRKAVLGVEHVQRSLEKAGRFAGPWQDFITRSAWGDIWGDPALPWKTRSMLVLAMMAALHREEEFKLHLRPALKNGVTPAELRAILLQTAIYAGVPAANAAFRWARDVLGAEADDIDTAQGRDTEQG